jgi:SPP1 gp7 family putative phage head morphogenesis protein
MPTANEEIQDSTIASQVLVQGFIAGQVGEFVEAIRATDAEVTGLLRARLPVRLRSREFQELIRDLTAIRRSAFDTFKETFAATLGAFAEQQSEAERVNISNAIPIDHTVRPARPLPSGQILNTPFQVSESAAATMNSLFESVLDSDRRRITSAIQLGLARGETVDEMIRRLRGTARSGFTDGVLSATRRQAETLVRTVTNHLANEARERVFQANSDVIRAVRWVSTLDTRTSPVCRYRDGRLAPIGDQPLPSNVPKLSPPTARPPAHFSCRSIMVALISLDSIIGDRPFVEGERLNFRQVARDRVGDTRWRGLPESERRRLTRLARDRWTREHVGSVPATTTYYEWLSSRPASVQDTVLGPTRAKLLREGKLSASQLHDTLGNPLTLAELASRYGDLGVGN